MIGIQSIANQCQSNGLSSRVPYDVGKSINTWRSTPTIDTAISIPSGASRSSAAPDPALAFGLRQRSS